MSTWIIVAGVLVLLAILGAAVLAVLVATRDKEALDEAPAPSPEPPAEQSPGLELGGGTSLNRPGD